MTIEKEREEIASYKEEISRLKKNIEQKEERLDERKEKLLKNANEEAQRILREAKETADQTIRNINKLAASSGVGKELEAERTKLREKLDKVDKNLSLKNNKGPKKTISPKKLKIGDGVKVLTMNLKGTVSTLPNAKGDLYVQMGILRSLVNIKDLELLDEASGCHEAEQHGKRKDQDGEVLLCLPGSQSDRNDHGRGDACPRQISG